MTSMTSISGEGGDGDGDGEDGGMAGGFVFMVKSCRLVPCKRPLQLWQPG